jgi:asparagine synthase (glutamine-hydrolysing)
VFRAKTTFQGMARTAVDAYFHSMCFVREPMRSQLFSGSLKSALAGYSAQQVFERHARRADTDDPLALVQYIDMHTYLVGDINTKVDRASMAHSLEVREPLMDHELVEWVATLPSAMKLNGGEGKLVLKRALEPALPNDVLYRAKMGFAVPLARWLRGPLKQRVRESLLGPRLLDSGYFDARYISRLIDEHQSGVRDHGTPLWTLLMFDAFLARQSAPSTAAARTALAEAA